MRWMQLAHNPEQLLEHFRRLIADFGVTEELATRIHKLHGLLTAAAKASLSSDPAPRSRDSGHSSRGYRCHQCYPWLNSPALVQV
jgi:hypothetical protein